MLSTWVAFTLDFFLGDPPWFPHPVRFIGNLIKVLEKTIRYFCKSAKQEIIGGGLLVFVCLSVIFSITLTIIEIARSIHPFLYFLVNSILMYFTIAANCLKFEGKRIAGFLKKGDLVNGRKYLGYIVSRDTAGLNEKEILRGTIETVAENTSDGVIAPLFYMIIGGAPLAMVYKGINTMDSMLGYKNERYIHFGRIAAKLDDLANFIPARITALLIIISSGVLKLSWKGSAKILRRDRRNHASPNSGFPEAAVAGALGIQLGGVSQYFGVPVSKPLIGDPEKELEPEDIHRVNRLMYWSSLLFLIICTVIYGIWLIFFNEWYHI